MSPSSTTTNRARGGGATASGAWAQGAGAVGEEASARGSSAQGGGGARWNGPKGEPDDESSVEADVDARGVWSAAEDACGALELEVDEGGTGNHAKSAWLTG